MYIGTRIILLWSTKQRKLTDLKSNILRFVELIKSISIQEVTSQDKEMWDNIFQNFF